MATAGIHAFVSGKVQGVFYRDSTRVQANQLKLSGWVRNLDDGRVELKAFGTEQQLNSLVTWLETGPMLARVSNVQVASIPYEKHNEFHIVKHLV
ncbi:MAG: acylphosphatase [Coxiellaceae bacterium]|nr:acylphosphatase [Coxiellaceae bacterium]